MGFGMNEIRGNPTQEVIDVHALAPPFLVPDLVLVFEVADDFRLAR